MSESAEALLDAVTRQEGRLLRAEIVPLPGRPGARRRRGLVLTFDVGPLLLAPADGGRELLVRPVSELDPPAGEARSADEEEPWWALLGQELVRARVRLAAGGRCEALELQFRADDQNPRRVSLELTGGEIQVSAELGRIG